MRVWLESGGEALSLLKCSPSVPLALRNILKLLFSSVKGLKFLKMLRFWENKCSFFLKEDYLDAPTEV